MNGVTPLASRLADFLAKCYATVYAEPRCQLHDDLTRAMAEAFSANLPVGATILDVGCGQGPALENFTARGFRAIGITLSWEDCVACQGKGYDCREMDQNNMPDAWNGFFDAVWARHVVEHSPIAFFTLLEYFRVLKPGGWLYMEVPAPGTAARHHTNPNHYSCFSLCAWGSLLERAGFVGADYCEEINIAIEAGPDQYFSFTCQKPFVVQTDLEFEALGK